MPKRMLLRSMRDIFSQQSSNLLIYQATAFSPVWSTPLLPGLFSSKAEATNLPCQYDSSSIIEYYCQYIQDYTVDQSQQEILYNILNMLARKIFFGLQKVGLVVARGSGFGRGLAFSFGYFDRKQKEKGREQVQRMGENVSRKQTQVKDVKNEVIAPALIWQLKSLSDLMSKRSIFMQTQFDSIRKSFRQFPYPKLRQSSFQTIETVAKFCNLAVSHNIILKKDLTPVQMTIYQSFIKKVEDIKVNSNASWVTVGQCYRVLSEFNILVMGLHPKVPFLVSGYLVKKDKDKNKWPFSRHVLLDVLHGLACREIIVKDERTAIVMIVSYFDRQYRFLTENEKVQLLKELIFLNPKKRFGVVLGSQSNIFSHFLKDLQSDAFNIWKTGVFSFIQNDYPVNHKHISLINSIIIHQAFQMIDSKGVTRIPMTPEQFLTIILNYSKKHNIKKLTEIQKAKMLEFFNRQIRLNANPTNVQQYLAMIINNDFFADHSHALKLLFQHSKAKTIIPLLLFQFTRAGIKIDKAYLEVLEGDGGRQLRVQDHALEKEELLIMLIARMQLQINPKNQYYQTLFNSYLVVLQETAKVNCFKLLLQLVKMPQISLYYLHKLIDMSPVYAILAQKQLTSRYSVSKNYLYLLIKYAKTSLQEVLASKLYNPTLIDQLVFEFMTIQLQSKQKTRYTSRNLFVFLTKYLQHQLTTPKTFLKFQAVKKIMDYLLIVSQQFKQGNISYQSKLYFKYWKMVMLLLQNIDVIIADVQWRLKFDQFIDIMMVKSGEHFNHTQEYNSFISKLLTILPKMKPHYSTISNILVAAVYNGLISHLNYQPLFKFINTSYDIKKEQKQIIILWSSSPEQQPKLESEYALIKFINPSKEYTSSDVYNIRQEIEKYELQKLCQILQLFALPINPQSAKLYQDLLKQLRKQPLYHLAVNLIPVLHNILKYVIPFETAQNKQESFVSNFAKEVLMHCFGNFQKMTIHYHLKVIELSRNLNVTNREYQRLLFGRVIADREKDAIAIEVVTVLAKGEHEYGFNYKELKVIEEVMRLSKQNWKEVFQLLKDRFQPQQAQELSQLLFLREQPPSITQP